MNDESGSEHPSMKQAVKLGTAFTIDQQWERADGWYRLLQSERTGERAHWAAYMLAWDVAGADWVERGKDLKGMAGPPIATLFWCVKEGIYPPPELLLTLLDCWEIYMGNAGKISLEAAFIGRVRKGAGNFAHRDYSLKRKMGINGKFLGLLREGKTRAEAAELISSGMGGKPDADSILRMTRSFGLLKARKKPEK